MYPCVFSVSVYVCMCVSVCSFSLFSIVSWRAVRGYYPPNHSWFYPSPHPKPICHTRHGGTPFSGWGWVGAGADKSSNASQPVNLQSVNHNLTNTWSVPLSLVRKWFVPLPVCDHSQGVFFPPNTRGGIMFFGFYTNKQTNKRTHDQHTFISTSCHYMRFNESKESPKTHVHTDIWDANEESCSAKERKKKRKGLKLDLGKAINWIAISLCSVAYSACERIHDWLMIAFDFSSE